MDNSTGERIYCHCLRYACDKHGWKKVKKLERAIREYIKKWEMIRFWTFTISSRNFTSPQEHYKTLALAWRYFSTYLRRDPNYTIEEQKLQYIKVCEPHKSGYFHFHAFFDRYVPIHKIWTTWQRAIRAASGQDDLQGYVWAVGKIGVAKAAGYVVKYVVKSAKALYFRLNYYSKSSKVKLFPEKHRNPNIIFLPPNAMLCDYLDCINPLLVHTIPIVTDNSPPIAPYQPRRYKEDKPKHQIESFFPYNDEVDNYLDYFAD